VHSLLSGPRWTVDLVGTGLVGGLAYYTAFLLFGLTAVEKGAVMRVLQNVRSDPA
jgi:hypothetical protein